MERVKAEFHGPRYDWFLEKLSRSEHNWLPMERSCLYILDFDGNAAPKEVLRAAASENLHGGVLDALNSKLSSTTTTRLVLLYYPRKHDLNFRFIGAMGHALGLDARFFTTHFRDSNPEKRDTHRRPPSLLHLDTRFLQLYFSEGRYVTACTMGNVGRSTSYPGDHLLLSELIQSNA